MTLTEINRNLTFIISNATNRQVVQRATLMRNYFSSSRIKIVSGNAQIPVKSDGNKMINAASLEEVMDLSIISTESMKGQQLIAAIQELLDYTKSLEANQ